MVSAFKDYDVIILSHSRWDNPYSSVGFSMAKEFAKNNRTFVIDHPFTVKDYILQKSSPDVQSRKPALFFKKDIFSHPKGVPENITIVTPRITIPINWMKDGAFYDVISHWIDKQNFDALRTTIATYGIKKYIFINVFDPNYFRRFPSDIKKPAVRIYTSIDDMTQEPYIAKHGIRLEEEASRAADFTTGTSSELVKHLKQFSRKSYCIPNAADFSLFEKARKERLPRPKELENVNTKVICYTGVIGTRINYELLREVAVRNTDKTLLMVGPVDNDGCKNAGLYDLPNVIFAGAKNIKELPSYLQYADCAIIPFEYSRLTKSIYPLKINEYLTAGKPVVTTAFSEDIKGFYDVAYVSQTNEEFLQNINRAIAEDSEELQIKRAEKASENSWTCRIEAFWEGVAEVLGKPELEPEAV